MAREMVVRREPVIDPDSAIREYGGGPCHALVRRGGVDRNALDRERLKNAARTYHQTPRPDIKLVLDLFV